jgi:hypothetical protein
MLTMATSLQEAKKDSGVSKAANQAETNRGIAENLSSPVNVVATGKLQLESPNKQEQRHDYFFQNPEWWLVVCTGLLVCVTAGLVKFTKKLWKSTSDLVEDAKGTSKRELRAYIGMGGGEVFVLPNNILRGVVEIKNFGETPARNVMVAITGELRTPGDIRTFNDPDFIPHKQPIAPTMSWTFGHEFLGMTDQDLKDVLADKKLVYIWGHVRYQDIYNETQTLRFRLRNVVKLLVTTEEGTSITKWKFYPEDEGNEAT